ncbi:MAG: DinB family protein [Thermoanaerobaculia bacterium]|nr:DinB family protein [Thermoanaerobaculia bacterium]
MAHALLQVLDEIERGTAKLAESDVWRSPGNVASIGFHLRHLAGSTDRLLTYARGVELSDPQREELATESSDQQPPLADLLARLRDVFDRAVEQLRATPQAEIYEAREVGRARLPSSAHGLLFHAAEHAQRHCGQIVTTVKLL